MILYSQQAFQQLRLETTTFLITAFQRLQENVDHQILNKTSIVRDSICYLALNLYFIVFYFILYLYFMTVFTELWSV